jgi:hypothetical protein
MLIVAYVPAPSLKKTRKQIVQSFKEIMANKHRRFKFREIENKQ